MAGSDLRRRARAALARGQEALAARRATDHWSGFPTLAGRSSVWVTAFVTAHLAGSGAPRESLRDARAWLVGQRYPGGGWGYGGEVPADADSTAWSLIALRGSAMLDRRALREASVFLAAHQRESGTATYLDDGRIRGYIQAPASLSMAGWTGTHCDVTAAALLAGSPPRGTPAARATLARLLSHQSGAGLWEAYWWRGPWYTTALVLRALDRAGVQPPERVARRILGALGREMLADGGFGLGASMQSDAFTTALALECHCRLASLGGIEARERTAAALLALQGPDGAWPGAPVLRIPAPDVLEPRHVSSWSLGSGGGNSFVIDEGGLFATALACFALKAGLDVKATRPAGPILEAPATPPQLLGEDVMTVARV